MSQANEHSRTTASPADLRAQALSDARTAVRAMELGDWTIAGVGLRLAMDGLEAAARSEGDGGDGKR